MKTLLIYDCDTLIVITDKFDWHFLDIIQKVGKLT